MKSIGARVALKLVFAHGLFTRWTLTGEGISRDGRPSICNIKIYKGLY
jgi:hypothetical protein